MTQKCFFESVNCVSEIWLLCFILSYFPWNTYTKCCDIQKNLRWEQNEIILSHMTQLGTKGTFPPREYIKSGSGSSYTAHCGKYGFQLWHFEVWIGLAQRQEGQLAIVIHATESLRKPLSMGLATITMLTHKQHVRHHGVYSRACVFGRKVQRL